MRTGLSEPQAEMVMAAVGVTALRNPGDCRNGDLGTATKKSEARKRAARDSPSKDAQLVACFESTWYRGSRKAVPG